MCTSCTRTENYIKPGGTADIKTHKYTHTHAYNWLIEDFVFHRVQKCDLHPCEGTPAGWWLTLEFATHLIQEQSVSKVKDHFGIIGPRVGFHLFGKYSIYIYKWFHGFSSVALVHFSDQNWISNNYLFGFDIIVSLLFIKKAVSHFSERLSNALPYPYFFKQDVFRREIVPCSDLYFFLGGGGLYSAVFSFVYHSEVF